MAVRKRARPVKTETQKLLEQRRDLVSQVLALMSNSELSLLQTAITGIMTARVEAKAEAKAEAIVEAAEAIVKASVETNNNPQPAELVDAVTSSNTESGEMCSGMQSNSRAGLRADSDQAIVEEPAKTLA